MKQINKCCSFINAVNCFEDSSKKRNRTQILFLKKNVSMFLAYLLHFVFKIFLFLTF